MTQSQALQEAKLQECKDRVAKIHFCRATNVEDFDCPWDNLNAETQAKLVDQVAIEYSSSKDKEIEELKSIINADPSDIKFHYKSLKNDLENIEEENRDLKSQLQQATASSSSGEREDVGLEKQLADRWAKAEAKSGGLGQSQENALAKGYFWGRQSLPPPLHKGV